MPLLLPGQADGAGAEQILSRAMSPPHFPIRPGDLRGDWAFGTIEPGHRDAEGFSVEVREIPHKGGRTLGYRVSDGRSVVAYVTDHCPTAFGPGPDGWGEYHANALELPPPTTRWAWPSGPGPGGWSCPTTSPTGLTPRSMRSAAGSPGPPSTSWSQPRAGY